jgi:muramoyltetrapeptide carboxypeptidase LdcA involved in peptidoglycan recycling
MLTQLAINHVFDHIAALGCGIFTVHGGKDQELLQLFAEIAVKYTIPCFHGFQFGHVFPMQAVNSRQNLTIYSD